jgi:hypothetical protein
LETTGPRLEVDVETPTPIESLPNLGPKSGQWLREAGITTIAELERLGPVVAYRLVKQRQSKAGLNLLWALAAGIEGCGLAGTHQDGQEATSQGSG